MFKPWSRQFETDFEPFWARDAPRLLVKFPGQRFLALVAAEAVRMEVNGFHLVVGPYQNMKAYESQSGLESHLLDSIYSLSIQYQKKHQENTKEQNHIKLPASHTQPPSHDLFGAASTALAFAHGAWRAQQAKRQRLRLRLAQQIRWRGGPVVSPRTLG